MNITWLILLSLVVFIPAAYAEISYHTSGFYALDGPTGIDTIKIQNHTYAVISSSNDGAIQILNISNPHMPQPIYGIFSRYLDDAQDVIAVNSEGRAYVLVAGAKTDTIQIIDITNPNTPIVISDTVGGAVGVDASGNMVELHYMDGRRATDGTSGFAALGGINSLGILPMPGNYTYVVSSGHTDNAIQITDVTYYDYPGHAFDYNCMYAPRAVTSISDGMGNTKLDGVWNTLHVKKWDREYIFASGPDSYISVLDVSHISTPYTDLRPCDDPRRKQTYQDDSTAVPFAGPQSRISASLFGPQSIITITNDTDGFGDLNDITDMVAITPAHKTGNTIPTRVYDNIPQEPKDTYTTTFPRGPTHIIAASHADSSVQVIKINSTYAHHLNATHDTMQLPPRVDLPDVTLTHTHTIHDDTDGFDALGGAQRISLAHINNHTIGVVAGFDDNALQIIDFTAPEEPKPIYGIFDGTGGFEALGGVTDVKITHIDNHTYVIAASHLDDGIQIIDITNPYSPIPVSGAFDQSYFDALGGASHITITEISDRTYGIVMGSADNSVQIIDFTTPASPIPAASIFDDTNGFEALGGAQDFALTTVDNRTYGIVVGHSDSALQIMDITIPNNPEPISAIFDDRNGFEALGGASGIDTVTISGHSYAVISSKSDNAIQIVNITDPARPEPISATFDDTNGFEALGGANRIQCQNTYCLVTASRDNAVQILDVTQPDSPQPLAAIFDGRNDFKALKNAEELQIATINGQTFGIVTSKNDDALQVINITNPASPGMVSNLFRHTDGFDSLNGIRNVGIATISGHTYIITASGLGGTVSILNMTFPDSPKVVSTIHHNEYGLGDLYGVIGIDFTERDGHTYAILSSKDRNSILIIDITEPSAPLLVSVINDQKSQ